MTKETIKEMERLKSLTRYSIQDIEAIENFVRENIDTNCKKICKRCPSQARFAVGRIKAWEKKNQDQINKVRDEDKSKTKHKTKKG